jgi:N-acetyl-1-D-myo-inositol-2-amino-2-deoxy-alpha-D-glucopyranoside deacetylase
VVSFGEDGLYYHPDHITAYHLSRRAVGRSASRPALYRALWLTADIRELMAELHRRRLAQELWGLDPNGFGLDEEPADAIRLDLRPFTAQKLRALRRHRTQLPEAHALAGLPDDLAERFLGYERFAPVQRPSAIDFFDRIAPAEVAHV